MDQEIKVGSVSVSTETHSFFTGLVVHNEKNLDDRPFTSIVEAFRFAFALGYSLNSREKKSGSSEGMAPRQFVVTDYEVILRDICIKEGISLGALCSQYAEAGATLMSDTIKKGGTILELV